MTDHIYGRANLVTDNNRAHVFINELFLYIDYLGKLVSEKYVLIDKKKENILPNFITS